MKKTVIYYTTPPFLDIALEKINVIKSEVNLHLLIEVAPGTSSRIFKGSLPKGRIIVGISELLDNESYRYVEPYLSGCSSCNFIIHRSFSGFSLSTFIISYRTWKFIQSLNPDIIDLEVPTLRSLGLVPFLISKKKFFETVHDPIPHSGHGSIKERFARFIFFKLALSKRFFFYSKFSKQQFEDYYEKDRCPKYVIRMYPYSYYKNFVKLSSSKKKHILFFGVVSQYKGVDILLDAISLVFEENKDDILVIAGHAKAGYNLDSGILEKFKDRIVLIDRYVQVEELVTLIQDSKFVVCPYRDATQSGVLMTSFALNKPVIATNVGSFPEYIDHFQTGLLVAPCNSIELANAIKFALKDNFYSELERNLIKINKTKTWQENRKVFLEAYDS